MSVLPVQDGTGILWKVSHNQVGTMSEAFNFMLVVLQTAYGRSGGRAVECQTVNRGDGGSIPPTAILKLRQFRSSHICLCLLEETLTAGGYF